MLQVFTIADGAVDASSNRCFNKPILTSVILESSFNYFALGALFFISYVTNFCLKVILNLLYFLTRSNWTKEITTPSRRTDVFLYLSVGVCSHSNFEIFQ